MPSKWLYFARRGISPTLVVVASTLSVAGWVIANTKIAAAQPAVTGAPKAASVGLTRRKASHGFGASHSAPRSFDGVASYYSLGSLVATGARFDPNGFTAAHRSLPFGTRVRVSDFKSGRSVIVTINDRGPFVPGRVLDLALGAARALGMQGRGVSRVHGEVLYAGGGAPKTLTHVKALKARVISASDSQRPMGNVRRPAALPGKGDAKSSRT